MTNLEQAAAALIESIVTEAMATDYEEAMRPFTDLVSPQMAKMIRTVFESGVRIGASRAFISVVSK